MVGAAVGQPHPRFPIAHEHVPSLGEWPRMGGRHVLDRRKSKGGVNLRRVTSDVVVRTLGPAMAFLTTAIANTTKNPRYAFAIGGTTSTRSSLKRFQLALELGDLLLQ
jgi:hypothetical protein